MTQPLYMIEIRLDAGRLIRFLQDHGANRNSDEDFGYGAHVWLKAVFGTLAPKPFRVLQSKNGSLRLLGYTSQSSQSLADHAAAFASPLALAAFNLKDLCAKEMPNEWSPGRRLGFETLVCPVTRQGASEKDVLLRRVAHKPAEQPFISRETAYQDWFARQLGRTAVVESAKLASFRLVRMLRMSRKNEELRRQAPRILRPQALLRGVLRVEDSARFSTLLARGLGRHRAFGYGMVLLRPVS